MTGDIVDYGGIWRPRPNITMCKSRYDRAVFTRIEAERAYNDALRVYGPDAVETIEAKRALEAAWVAQSTAMKEADTKQVRERDRIDLWRKERSAEYNAKRRKKRETPNSDLTGMSPEEMAEHIRAREREKKRRQRAAAKAAKANSK